MCLPSMSQKVCPLRLATKLPWLTSLEMFFYEKKKAKTVAKNNLYILVIGVKHFLSC